MHVIELIKKYGFLSKYLRGKITSAQKSKQHFIVSQLKNENSKVISVTTSQDLNLIFASIKQYREKLDGIKQQITAIHTKTANLKKRSLKIQLQKQKDASVRNQQREKERALIVQHSSSS